MKESLWRGIEEIIDQKQLEKLLAGTKPLRLKFGVDPSSPDIHLGHTVILRCLARLQKLGHTVIFLIGDTTALIGDPSGKNKTRPVIDRDEVERNAKTYLEQVNKILDVDKAEIRRNSEWLDDLSLAKLLELASNFTVAQLIEREDFKNRLDAGSDLGLHELIYPLMVAYDSVVLKADVEFGGTDQRFNMLAGRALQKKMGQPAQQVVMGKLLVGTDGSQKMSKSLGNYIGITDAASDMYGKIMSIPDNLIVPYYELCTDIDQPVLEQLTKTLAEGANPRDAKASLAREIVTIYHGEEAALAAEVDFDRVFRHKELPQNIVEVEVSTGDQDVATMLVELGLSQTKSEAKRVIVQGGVRINGQRVSEAKHNFKSGDVVQVGKLRSARLK
ncbi:MAG TPA: tyrosine--tRNA ligase [Candidatus Saccharimonadales bacterium]|nr:tyrosine--tRNA ligase [Candidatus Saccharimonadales bacterium]